MTALFASIELAARIDRAEARLSASLAEAVAARDPRVHAFVERIGDGVAVYAGPSSPVNKMIGAGFDGVPPDDRLEIIEEQFSVRRAPLQAEVATLADPAFAAALTRRGYVLEGFENVLGRQISTEDGTVEARGRITVEPMREGEGESWLDTALTGFMHLDAQGVQPPPIPPRDALERAMRDLTDVPGFRRYVARVDGRIAGVASFRMDDGVAQLCGAATLPEFRRQGVQRALLQQRLLDALHGSCDVAVMTTQPGSLSQANGYRLGFVLLYSRALLVRPAGARRHRLSKPSRPTPRAAI